MDIGLRRALYTFFILIFLALAPVLIGYARGYRYSIREGEIYQTGVLILESDPDKAKVILDGRNTSRKTLATFKNLRPNDYLVTITKDGFSSWSKRLSVTAGEATIADRITLFRENGKESVIRDDLATLSMRSRREEILYTITADNGETELHRYHTRSENNIFIYKTENTLEEYTLSRHGTAVLTREKTASGMLEFHIINVNLTESSFLLNELFKEPISSAEWSQDSDDVLLVTTETETFVVTRSSRKVTPLSVDPRLTQFEFLTSTHFFSVDDRVLTSVNTENNSTTTLLTDTSPQLTLCPYSADLIALFSSEDQQLIILDRLRSTPQIDILDLHGEGCDWTADGEDLLFWDELEIGMYDHTTMSSTVLSRVSDTLSNVQFYANEFYVVYQTEKGGVFALEIDGRDRRNTHTLAENAADFTLSDNGKKLYLKIKNPSGSLTLVGKTIQ